MPRADTAAYDAFISYSHAKDRPVAVAVQQGLHRLAKRWYQVRALRVFRDDTSLSANPHLWGAIEQGLRGSRYFILMASPEAAASQWVCQEIAFWQRNFDPRTFLIVVSEGEIRWDAARGDFDWNRTTALPRQLSGWFAAEPLWVRLDGARRDTQLSPRNAEFRSAICKLAAPLHNARPDDLDSTDIRQHRAASRVRRAAVAALSLLLVIAVVLGAVAIRQRDEARHQARIAGARALALEADTLADRDPVLAVRLSLAAYRLDPAGRQTSQSLLRSLDRNRHVLWYVVQEPSLTEAGDATGDDTGRAGTVAVSPDGTMLAVGARWTGQVQLWDLTNRRQLGSLGAEPNSSDRFGPPLRFSDDGTKLYVTTLETTDVWDVRERRRLSSSRGDTKGGGGTMAVSGDGRVAISGDDSGQIFLLDENRQRRAEMLVKLPDVIDGVALSSDGSIGAAVDKHGNVATMRTRDDRRFDTLSGPPPPEPPDGPGRPGPGLVPSPDGGRVLVERPGLVELWQVDDRRKLAEFPTAEQYPATALIDAPTAVFS